MSFITFQCKVIFRNPKGEKSVEGVVKKLDKKGKIIRVKDFLRLYNLQAWEPSFAWILRYKSLPFESKRTFS